MTLLKDAKAACKRLEKAGLEPTLNRILVLSAILNVKHAMTAREVHETVLAEHKLNRVTVYRILDILAEKGAVNRIAMGEKALHFCVGHDHSHFHCTGCGEIRCIANADLGFDSATVSTGLPMDVSHVDLHLEGLCEKCGTAANS